MKPSCTGLHNKDMKIHDGSPAQAGQAMRNNLIYNNITQIFSNENKASTNYI